MPLTELLGDDSTSIRAKSQLLYLDDLINQGHATVAYEYLEHLWWDATQTRAKPLIFQIYQRVLRMLDTDLLDDDLSWPNTVIMWLLSEGEHIRAMELGYLLQRALFRQRKWAAATRWGKTLLRMPGPPELRTRIGIGTGSALLRQGDFLQSEQQYRDVLEWVRDGEVVAWAVHGLSSVYGQLNEWSKAKAKAEKACEMYRVTNSPMYWLALQNVGIIGGVLGNMHEARQVLAQCQEHWERASNWERAQDVENDIRSL